MGSADAKRAAERFAEIMGLDLGARG
jgi:hypothetical protein